jgi:hypothetical protein
MTSLERERARLKLLAVASAAFSLLSFAGAYGAYSAGDGRSYGVAGALLYWLARWLAPDSVVAVRVVVLTALGTVYLVAFIAVCAALRSSVYSRTSMR